MRYVDQAAQDLVRDKESGRGYLYPDTFSEERLLFLPPASSVLLVILSRNHNVSSHSLLLNVHGNWLVHLRYAPQDKRER